MAELYFYCEGDNVFSSDSVSVVCESAISAVSLPELSTDQLTAQLSSIGEFDLTSISTMVVIYLVMFVSGVSAGHVMRIMRRA